jgi:hypothetical protein
MNLVYIRKCILLTTMLVLLGSSLTHARPYRPQPIQQSSKRTAVDTLKYGITLAGSMTSGEIGGFVEFKINSMIGVETGLRFVSSAYQVIKPEINSPYAVVGARSLTIPLIGRFYPGSDRQFAWYAGLQSGYVVGGKVVPLLKSIPELKRSDIASLEKHDLSSFPSEKVASWQVASIVGFDYETDIGLIFGFKYTKEMIPLIASEDMEFAWHLMLSLGANIGAWF